MDATLAPTLAFPHCNVQQTIAQAQFLSHDLASIAFLVSWELWNESNARVLKNKQAPPSVIFQKIKQEAKFWVLAGAKRTGNLMPGE
jgi:hypothetical protein